MEANCDDAKSCMTGPSAGGTEYQLALAWVFLYEFIVRTLKDTFGQWKSEEDPKGLEDLRRPNAYTFESRRRRLLLKQLVRMDSRICLTGFED